MEFKFKIQDYQTKAVNAVIDVFSGQPFESGLSYSIDKGDDYSLLADEYLGYSNNAVSLDSSDILHNIRDIQKSNNIPLSETLSKELGAVSLDVEMETGTGKTYVYIKTMFELNRRYGWSKFIVVVPSIAIREGVKKSFEMTVDHFMEHYQKKAHYFIYDSDDLTKIESFSSSADINVMIINMQAFNTSLKEGANNKGARKIYTERDEFGSRRPIDVIKANRPILILDEPQKMAGSKTQEALKNFNPLFAINYSATHRKKHNAVYVLDALEAYNERLVKKIEVKGFEIKNITGTDGYLFLQEIVLSPNKPPMAKIEHEMLLKSGAVKRIVHNFEEGDSIYAQSENLAEYRDGYFITDVNPISNSVTLGNGITLTAGDAIGDVSEDDIRRIQIRETIISHFEKEKELFDKGIKTLSLFFIDEVAKYRQYDEDGNAQLGEYGKVFEEEYQAELDNRLSLFQNEAYQKYLREKCSDVHAVHNGYFSIDKKTGRYINSKESERDSKLSDDISAYDLILKNKERLLSFEEPTRFIFSHSALREGWDNPNIFQICTLKYSDNSIAQRQEVGRGLRICVDKNGNRMDKQVLGSSVFDVNLLTVVASDSYASFVSTLQDEIKENLAERPRRAEVNYFQGKTVKNQAGTEHVITLQEARDIYFYLIQNGYIDRDESVTDKFRNDESNGTLAAGLDLSIEPYKEDIIKLVKSVFDPSVLNDMFKDGRETKVRENPLNENFEKEEFQRLWKAITPRFVYKVEFESKELITKAICYINENLKIKKLQYILRKGQQREDMSFDDMSNKDGFEVRESENKFVAHKASKTQYDLVGDISKNTNLTRRSIVAILKGLRIDVFDMFKENPEDFIVQVSKMINSQKATMVVQHITYSEAKGLPPYDASLFTAEKSDRDFLKAYESKRGIQKYIFPDSTNEYNFAKDLDAANEVYIYAKLPRGFQIPTPVGNYAPDWAVVFKKGLMKHVFFVAETKGSLDSEELRTIEESKISCAKKLFNMIQSEDIKYEKVTTYQDLLDKII